jgi:hypothetical protein
LDQRTKNEIEFLKKSIPLIIQRSPNRNLSKLKDEIIATAKSFGQKSGTLSLVSVLSCLYEDEKRTDLLAARKILKPKENYSNENAYNALFDLRMLELFLLFQPFMNEAFSLCTCDKNLTAFWCGIQPAYGELKAETPQYTISLTETLFPRMSEKERFLLADLP